MTPVALVDYGAGNLTSVRKALSTLGAECTTPREPADVAIARAIIVPGVGHFAATTALDEEWRSAIREAVHSGAALFGICLGMQWLFEGSEEAPGVAGFGAIAGHCLRLDPARPTNSTSPMLKIPHVGWNSLIQPRQTTLMAGVAPNAQVYFTHSYVAPVVPAAAAITDYGIAFSSAVEHGRIAGVQFHPEKSGDVGLHILRNWLHAL